MRSRVGTEPITTSPLSFLVKIGEFNNSGPASQQYGYLSSITGLGSVFSGTPKDETTALYFCDERDNVPSGESRAIPNR